VCVLVSPGYRLPEGQTNASTATTPKNRAAARVIPSKTMPPAKAMPSEIMQQVNTMSGKIGPQQGQCPVKICYR
jgi:hypothetical protein